LKTFFQSLETAPGLTRSAADWKRLLGSDFEHARKFLRLKSGLSGAVPCPVVPPCGCDHVVVEHSRDDITAVCCCEPQRCRTVPIKREEALIYELNFPTFDGTIARALSLTAEDKTIPGVGATLLIGIYTPRANVKIPVYLTVQCDSANFQRVVEKLAIINHAPFILLAPTENFLKDATNKLLREHNARLLALERILIWNGAFAAKTPLEELLADFLEQVAPAKELYVLRKEGETWHAVFEGEVRSVPHTIGMDYIAALLASPHRKIPCAKLAGTEQIPLFEAEAETAEDDYARRPKSGKSLNANALLDRKAVNNYKKRIAEIETQMEIAQATNTDKVEHLERERKTLEREISRAQGMHGKLRVNDASEKARKAVTAAITRAFSGIEHAHPKFWRHLKATIRTGIDPIYKPDKVISWEIQR